jgi:hypothetical protein
MSGEGINLLYFHPKAVWTALCGRLLPEQRLDFAKQAVKCDRFGIVIVTAGHGVGSQGNNRNGPGLGRRFQVLRGFPAIDDREAYVHIVL